MADVEKVKAELDAIIDECRGCDYVRFAVVAEHCTNILDLLKEQEAVEPIPPVDDSDLWRCGNCGHQMFKLVHQRYCSECGRKVDW